ncbi:hypothetical protein CFC21_045990 [Triticum aestivum]|uniref:PGG domain-containing protein n=2 Tax=Triticum aestivum TaxID=4565 RepID=A0A9R1JZ93_WHEAT|nr:uncharacterized protein LOC123074024 [Triticum aestivum]KAF7035060.1 hypothetical protein CFC21_045990 [Triticum aestivum]
MPAYDVRCSLLEEGRLPAVAPRLVPKPKRTNPPWVRAIRAFGNTACVLFIVFILAFMVPRSRDKNHLRLFFNCAIPVLLSLGFPVMAYILTMDVDDQPQPQGACNA